MTLKIDKYAAGQKTVLRLTGRLQAEHLEQLKTQLTREPSPTALDLDSVTLVDVAVVQFLNACEDSGIELVHCCPYIREWMLREKNLIQN
jgi:anti-anti-sigma regulatory factor